MTAAAILLLISAGIAGLLVGSFLTTVISRLPADIALSWSSRCPLCAAPLTRRQTIPVVSWLVLRGRCASCRARISARYPWVEIATSLSFVGVVWGVVARSTDVGSGAGTPALLFVAVAYLYLAAMSIALTLIDVDTHRLPNAIVLPGYPVLVALFAGACLFGAEWGMLLRAAVAAIGLFAFYFLLRAIRPGGMGGGDVKLAGVLGFALGWIGWDAVLVGVFGAFLIGGLVGLILMVTRRATLTTALPFGPFMVVGAWVGIVVGEPVAIWYAGMLSLG